MTVLVTITTQDIEQHRPALIAWAEANGLDAARVAQDGVRIEQVGGRTVIAYDQFQLSDDGHRLVDPDRPGHALVVHRTAALVHALPEGIGRRPCTPGGACSDRPIDAEPVITEGDQTLGGTPLG